MTREQRLFSAAQLFLELHPVDPVNVFQVGTASYNEQEAKVHAHEDLREALAAYEGSDLPATTQGRLS
jgi:hypothetical protein